MSTDLHSASSLIKIQTSSDWIRTCQCICRRLHGCRRISTGTPYPVKPSRRRRTELSCLIDHCFDTVRIDTASHTVHDHRAHCNLPFIRLIPRLTEDDGRHQLLILRAQRFCFSFFPLSCLLFSLPDFFTNPFLLFLNLISK